MMMSQGIFGLEVMTEMPHQLAAQTKADALEKPAFRRGLVELFALHLGARLLH